MTNASLRRHVPFLPNVNFVFLAIVVSYFLGFLGNALITRNISADERGFYALYVVSVTMASSLSSLGYHNATLFFVGREGVDLPTAIGQMPYLVVVSVVLSSVVGIAGWLLLPQGVPGGLLTVALFVLGVAIVYTGMLVGTTLVTLGGFGRLNVLSIMRPGCLLIAVAAWLLTGELTLHRIIFFWVAVQFGVLITGIVLIGDTSLLAKFGHLDGSLLKRMLRFGLTGQMGNIATMLSLRLDSYIVLAFAGSSSVAFYAIATSVAEALWFLPQAISTVLLRRLTHDFGPDAGRFTAMVARSALTICVTGAVGIAIVSPVLVPMVFGDIYSRAVPALYCLLPGVIAGTISKVLANYNFGAGKVSYNSIISTISMVLTVLLDLALIPILGIVGAAIASSISYGAQAVLLLWVFRRLSGVGVTTALILQPGDLNEARYQLKRLFGSSRLLRRFV